MLLAVAGLSTDQLEERTNQLATDWSGFPEQEQLAFEFARRLSIEPWRMEDADFDGLQTQFGKHRAVDVLWWACRCHYMTRVADAFQLPLESENVFAR